jgi:hypothetical protein
VLPALPWLQEIIDTKATAVIDRDTFDTVDNLIELIERMGGEYFDQQYGLELIEETLSDGSKARSLRINKAI